jgi:hypothetical protein
MRAYVLIAASAIAACLPAHAEPPSAPVIANTPRIEVDPRPSAAEALASSILGQRRQGTVEDREEDDEVWSEDAAAPDDEGVAAPCKLCPQVPPARRLNLPSPTAPRN